MATSKTLTPTNVTIQIPEFTDQPDQRVNSNCIDKEADAINSLDAAIATLISNIGTLSNLTTTAKTSAVAAINEVNASKFISSKTELVGIAQHTTAQEYTVTDIDTFKLLSFHMYRYNNCNAIATISPNEFKEFTTNVGGIILQNASGDSATYYYVSNTKISVVTTGQGLHRVVGIK